MSCLKNHDDPKLAKYKCVMVLVNGHYYKKAEPTLERDNKTSWIALTLLERYITCQDGPAIQHATAIKIKKTQIRVLQSSARTLLASEWKRLLGSVERLCSNIMLN